MSFLQRLLGGRQTKAKDRQPITTAEQEQVRADEEPPPPAEADSELDVMDAGLGTGATLDADTTPPDGPAET